MRLPHFRSDTTLQQLVFVVGLTGVGKSTVLERVQASRPDVVLLPNRREITDQIIVPDVQRHEAIAVGPVHDRIERFRITAAYRERHRGGMAHALARWLADHPGVTSRSARETLVFDNLRGLAEVRAAHEAFLGASFLVLDSTPFTRLARLVGRADPFDRVSTPATAAATTAAIAANDTAGKPPDDAPGEASSEAERDLAGRLRRIEGIEDVFDPAEVAALAARDGLDAEDLFRAVRIIVEEQNNYDSGAARDYLQANLPADRRLVIDTDHVGTSHVAERALDWLDALFRSEP